MEHSEEAYVTYRETFPSDAFLQKYFGENVLIEGNPHRAEITQELYDGLRYLFDGVLRCSPKYLLQSQDGSAESYEPVHVFTDGVPAQWVDETLERRGLMLELSPEGFCALGQEFIFHCRAGALQNDEWWQWQTTGDSIWVEVIPEAVKAGLHKRRRSLAELLGSADKS